MENYINSILTIILIGIYWYNTKSQNEKIKAQSDIINDLREHVKFFDLQKIKEYVELREAEKDKLMAITKATIEKEFELKGKEQNPHQIESKIDIQGVSQTIIDNFLIEPYIYIVKELVFKSEEEVNIILEKEFPKNKHLLLEIIHNARQNIMQKYGVKEISKLADKINGH